MCSRYELNANPRQLVARFGLAVPPEMLPGPIIRPTESALVIDQARRPLILRWGLRVDWNPKPLINARAETMDSRTPFRFLLRRRCLVPASAFFEWRKDGRARRKNRIAAPAGIFALAGLLQGDRFVIATCAPCPAVAHIHDRMPAILSAETEAVWLDNAVPFAEAKAALVPFSGELVIEEEAANLSPTPPDLFG